MRSTLLFVVDSSNGQRGCKDCRLQKRSGALDVNRVDDLDDLVVA